MQPSSIQSGGRQFLPIATVLFGFAILVIVIGSTKAPGSPSPEQITKSVPLSPVTWSPDELLVSISPGETKTFDATFTTTVPLMSVELLVSETLVDYIAVEPSRFTLVEPGESVHIAVTATAHSDELPTSLGGSIILRQSVANLEYQEPLRVHLGIWQKFDDPTTGVSASIPPEFTEEFRLDAPNTLRPGAGVTFAEFRSSSEFEAAPADDLPGSGCVVSFGIEDNSRALSLDEWIDARTTTQPNEERSTIDVGSGEAVLFQGDGFLGLPYWTTYIGGGTGIVYVVELQVGTRDDTVLDDCEQKYFQILASFEVG